MTNEDEDEGEDEDEDEDGHGYDDTFEENGKNAHDDRSDLVDDDQEQEQVNCGQSNGTEKQPDNGKQSEPELDWFEKISSSPAIASAQLEEEDNSLLSPSHEKIDVDTGIDITDDESVLRAAALEF